MVSCQGLGAMAQVLLSWLRKTATGDDSVADRRMNHDAGADKNIVAAGAYKVCVKLLLVLCENKERAKPVK